MLKNSMKHSDEKTLSLQEKAIEHSKKEVVKKSKPPKMRLPQRPFNMNLYVVPYLALYFYSLITIGYGLYYSVTSYVLFGVMFLPIIWFVRRLGTSISRKGYDVILLNASVLGSTITNASFPGLFARQNLFHWFTTALLLVSIAFGKPILIIALFLYLVANAFSFFKQDMKVIAKTLFILSISGLVVSFVELLTMKQMDYLSIVIALLFYMLFEKTRGYKFSVDE